ncbi:MAG TPA: SdpI family protein [Allosphingosinicella sp.]|jgi:uncharacterized membrane protein
MTRRHVGLAAILMTVAMTGIGIAAALSLPADVQIPIHWGLDGQANGFAGKWIGLLMPAALVAFTSVLFRSLPALEPRKEGLERSEGLYLWAWIGLLVLSGALELVALSAAFGWAVPVSRIIFGAVGAMLVMIGNQLGKSRSMYLIGLRTPWTLASEEVWIRTHRLGGKIMVAGGLVIVLAAVLPLRGEFLGLLVLGVIAAVAGVPTVYSYWLWRREQNGQASG